MTSGTPASRRRRESASRSTSQFVCLKLGLSRLRRGELEALGGRPARETPRHMRHPPQPIPGREHERLLDPATPLQEPEDIAARHR